MPEFNQSYLEAYEIWVKKAEKSFCDYVLRVALTWWSDVAEKEIETLVKDKGKGHLISLAGIYFLLSYYGLHLFGDCLRTNLSILD